MEKKKLLISAAWISLFAILLLCAGLFIGNNYLNSLSYREQQQLFMNDGSYLASLFYQVGGLATLCSRFLVQFFWSKAAALCITLLLLGLVLFFGRKTYGFNLLLALFFTVCLSDNNLHYDALVAVVLALAALEPVRRMKGKGILIYGICASLLLFFLTAYGAIVFSISVLLICLHAKDRKLMIYASPALPVSLLTGFLSVLFGLVPGAADAFSYKLYYEPSVKMPLLPRGSAENERECMYELLVEAEDWDALYAAAGKNAKLSPADANYYRLACAEKGVLMDKLFTDNYFGPDDLVNFPSDYLTTARIARIMYSMGNMASAQCVAFNLAQATGDYCPGMFKMLAKIELMRGAWPLAEKYLYILSKSPHYRAWAEEMMGFVGDDAKVEADPELSRGRKSFPKEEGFVQTGMVAAEQRMVVDANPNDEKAMSWLIGYLLLSKDMAGLISLVDKYYGTPALRTLPKGVQEALLLFCTLREDIQEEVGLDDELVGYDVDWCLSHGVQRDLQRGLGVFMESASFGPDMVSSRFGKTAWYYILFVRGNESI